MLFLPLKQKNAKSSLKAGLIGVDNTMTLVMLMKHFFVPQVRHVNIAIRYFYITNRIMAGTISRVIYKPTEVMESDYFTQALQEKLSHTNKM